MVNLIIHLRNWTKGDWIRLIFRFRSKLNRSKLEYFKLPHTRGIFYPPIFGRTSMRKDGSLDSLAQATQWTPQLKAVTKLLLRNSKIEKRGFSRFLGKRWDSGKFSLEDAEHDKTNPRIRIRMRTISQACQICVRWISDCVRACEIHNVRSTMRILWNAQCALIGIESDLNDLAR